MSLFSQFSDTTVVNKKRLEMLFDGIFAIAMTILILEVKAPEVHGGMSNHQLLEAIGESVPTMGSYLLSFLVLGNLWHSHNEQYKHFEKVSGAMFWMQMTLLAIAAFFPYCASLIGRFHHTPITFIFYVAPVFLYSVAQAINWWFAKKHSVLVAELSDDEYARINRKNWSYVAKMAFTLMIVSSPFIYIEYFQR